MAIASGTRQWQSPTGKGQLPSDMADLSEAIANGNCHQLMPLAIAIGTYVWHLPIAIAVAISDCRWQLPLVIANGC